MLAIMGVRSLVRPVEVICGPNVLISRFQLVGIWLLLFPMWHGYVRSANPLGSTVEYGLTLVQDFHFGPCVGPDLIPARRWICTHPSCLEPRG
jgi:hypothetical protein